MKHKLLVGLAMATISLSAWAADTASSKHMRVHFTDGTVKAAALDKRPVLQFIDEKLSVSIVQKEVAVWALDAVQMINFGQPEAGDEIIAGTDGVENTYYNDSSNTHKILENGQVIIIRDGVRYNVLGVKL